MKFKVGQILTIKKKKIELLNYEGEYRRKADGMRVFPVPQSEKTEDGREHCYFEVWECLNFDTGNVELVKIPVYIFQENSEDYAGKDRRDVIDDSNEVTSLLDHLSCWYNGRDKNNFHLDIINDRHINHIERLRQLDSEDSDINFKTGVRLKLIQKEHPNLKTRKELLQWKQSFPDLFTKLQKHVYQN